MKTFEKKWNNRGVEDGITTMSKEVKSFVTAFRNMLKRELKGIDVLSIATGHYYLSGFVRSGDTYVYVSYNIPRDGDCIRMNDGRAVMYRIAENEKDFRGRGNHFYSIRELPDAIVGLIRREKLKQHN